MLRKYDEDFIEYLPQIRYAANKVVEKFGNAFIIDELVNEAWIRGRNSNRPNKSQFVQRATWDMKDYIRSIFGRIDYSYKGKKIETKKRPQFITNYNTPANNSDTHHLKSSIFDGEFYDENLLNLENRELIELILKATSKKQLAAIDLYYFGEKQMKEVGEEIGIAECTVSTHIKKGIEGCRLRIDFVDTIHAWQKAYGIADKEFVR